MNRRQATSTRKKSPHDLKRRVLMIARANLMMRLHYEDGLSWPMVGKRMDISTTRAREVGINGLQLLRWAIEDGRDVVFNPAPKYAALTESLLRKVEL